MAISFGNQFPIDTFKAVFKLDKLVVKELPNEAKTLIFEVPNISDPTKKLVGFVSHKYDPNKEKVITVCTESEPKEGRDPVFLMLHNPGGTATIKWEL